MQFSHLIPLLALSLHVSAHGVITAVTGTNGVAGQGFGVDASTPRDGTTRKPFQQDTSIIRDKEIAKGTTGVCGRTLEGGNNDVQAQLSAASAAGLPMAAADGTVTMTLHQVNADGAGPYTCDVTADATGQNFVKMTVTQNVPGVASLSLARAKDFPLVAKMPAGMACTGGPNANACLVRCRNSAIAGPFGSCVAVTNAASANANINANANANSSAVANANANSAGGASAGGVAVTGAGAVSGSGTSAATTSNAATGAGVGAGAGSAASSSSSSASGSAGAAGGLLNGVAGKLSDAAGAVGDAVSGAVDNVVGKLGGGLVARSAPPSPPSLPPTSTPSTPSKATTVGNANSQSQSPSEEAKLEAGDFTIPDVSIEEADAALAKDLERRGDVERMQRLRRSRIFGRGRRSGF